MTTLANRATPNEIAGYYHAGQRDKSGAPYIEHCAAVAFILQGRFPNHSEAEREAAWLHDTLEDTNASVESLKRMGVSDEALSIITELTRPKNSSYAGWIDRLARDGSLSAIRVKLCDLEHNLAPWRALPDARLRRRYLKVRLTLETALAIRLKREAACS